MSAIRARYEGTCHFCPERIYRGQYVVRWSTGWVHDQCSQRQSKEIVDKLEALDPTPANTLPVGRFGESTVAQKNKSASAWKRK